MPSSHKFSILCLVATALLAGTQATALADGFDPQRRQMVSDQLVRRGIQQKEVLEAMGIVPRHRFVPKPLQDLAYADQPLPIGHGQTISQPYIVALMSELLELRSGQRVLEIGTGSGYQAAVLAQMGAQVYSMEIVPALGRQARALLSALGYSNIHVQIGDGYQGWPQAAPFDGIIVTCAPGQIPEPLKAQLAEGGRMVIPVGAGFAQRLVLLTKQEGRILEKKIVDVRFVPMVDEAGKKY
jgi:protein-L-isoaspartate(D-aspartate) O-methyltransferase